MKKNDFVQILSASGTKFSSFLLEMEEMHRFQEWDTGRSYDEFEKLVEEFVREISQALQKACDKSLPTTSSSDLVNERLQKHFDKADKVLDNQRYINLPLCFIGATKLDSSPSRLSQVVPTSLSFLGCIAIFNKIPFAWFFVVSEPLHGLLRELNGLRMIRILRKDDQEFPARRLFRAGVKRIIFSLAIIGYLFTTSVFTYFQLTYTLTTIFSILAMIGMTFVVIDLICLFIIKYSRQS